MHDTALAIAKAFFEVYCPAAETIVELGSYDVNGSLRSVAPAGVRYIGLDAAAGPGVDLVVVPGQPLPVASDSIDAIVSSSMFEHDPAFWTTFLEMVRLLRPGGLIYINVPSNGLFHQYPHDCWRFYPDAGLALGRWAAANGAPVTLLESFVADRDRDNWNDFVAIFRKGEASGDELPPIADRFACRNVRRHGSEGIGRPSELTEDMEIIAQAVPAMDARRRGLGEPVAAAAELLQRLMADGTQKGFIDGCIDGIVSGWAFAPTLPGHVAAIDLFVDGQFAGSALAHEFRADVRESGIGSGMHGFGIRLPMTLGDGQPHELAMRCGLSGQEIATITLPIAPFGPSRLP